MCVIEITMHRKEIFYETKSLPTKLRKRDLYLLKNNILANYVFISIYGRNHHESNILGSEISLQN